MYSKNRKSTSLLLLLFSVAVLGCGKDEPAFIDPADANALSEVLVTPDGSRRMEGAPPSPTNRAESPGVTNLVDNLVSSNGSTAPLSFRYSNVGNNLGGCYIQIDGADSYFDVPYNATSGTSGTLAVPLGLPTNLLDGQFCVNFNAYDSNGEVSNTVSTCVTVLRLGTGALQVSLSWDTATDQDLYVTDPEGYTIYYGSKTSPSGGELDRDDLDGYGPENIYWLDAAPDGEYLVQVDDYETTATPNRVYVTVSAGGRSKSFEAVTQNGSRVDIVTITKRGNNFEF